MVSQPQNFPFKSALTQLKPLPRIVLRGALGFNQTKGLLSLAEWSLLTNHGRLLLAIENEPGLRVRGMADRLHLSDRGTSLIILRDLREAGQVTSRREAGRRVYYSVLPDKPLRTDFVRHQTVGQLLQLLAEAETSRHNEGKMASDAFARA